MNILRLACFSVLTCGALIARDAGGSLEPPKAEHDGFHLADLLPRSLNPNPKIGVSVMTEVSPEGKGVVPADPSHPVYYVAWDGGLVEEGDTVAGEVPPKPERLAAVMQRALAVSGYLPATPAHPPTLVIHYRWGSYNRIRPLDEEDPMREQAYRRNVFIRAMLVGGIDFARKLIRAADTGTVQFFRLENDKNDELTDMAMDDLYFVVAVAFDAGAAHQGKKVRLWTTKISTSSQGLAMDETLPTLASSGRRLFGHETNGPVLTNPRLLAGKVEVGEPVVVGDGSPPAAKPPPSQK
jgi:hypothetical protein